MANESIKGILAHIQDYIDNYGYFINWDRLSYENHLGNIFMLHIRDTIPAESTLEFAMKIPNIDMDVLPAYIKCSNNLDIDFYADVTVTANGGNIKSIITCLNQEINNTSQVDELLITPTITNYGTNTYKDMLLATKTGGEVVQTGLNWITKKDCYYSAKLVNLDNQVGRFCMSLYWIEKNE